MRQGILGQPGVNIDVGKLTNRIVKWIDLSVLRIKKRNEFLASEDNCWKVEKLPVLTAQPRLDRHLAAEPLERAGARCLILGTVSRRSGPTMYGDNRSFEVLFGLVPGFLCRRRG